MKRRKTTGAVVGHAPPEKLSQKRRIPKAPLIVIAILAGAIGTYALISSFAATQNKNCFSVPSACGYPDATNSGVPAGTNLTPSGSITASTPGQVINAMDVTGIIEVDANNVTIQNSRVTLNYGSCGTVNSCGNYEIRINQGVTGTIIKNSELRANSGITCEHDIRNTSSGSVQIIGDYLHGCDSNLYSVGNASMTDTYGIAKIDIANDHIENIYFSDSTFTANHVTLFNPVDQTAVIFGNVNGGSGGTCSNHLTVSNSLLAGGGFTVYPCGNGSSAGASVMNIHDNHFARCKTAAVYHSNGGTTTCQGGTDSNGYYPNSGDYGLASYYFTSGSNVWTNNVWDDSLQAVCPDTNLGCGSNGTPVNPPADTTAPAVSLTAPMSGSTVSGSAVTVSANASDNTGVAGVQFKLDGNNLGAEDTSGSYSTTWNTTSVANGGHTLTAVARDAAGNVKTSSNVTVTVNNTVATPPSGGGGSSSCTTAVSSTAAAQSAVSAAAAGQTVCLSDGTYGSLTLSSSKNVTLQAQNPGKTTVGAVSISGSGLTLANFRTSGEVTIQPGSSNITILHNFITGGYMGVTTCNSTTTTCNDIKIIGNKFQGPYGEDAIRANRYHDADGDGFGLIVSQNEISKVIENGNHSDCLQTVWVGDGIDFDHNYVHDNRCQGFFIKDQNSLCGGGSSGVCGTVKNVKVYNNIFTRNSEPCASTAPGCGQDTTIQIFGPVDGLNIDRNTMWGGDLTLTLRDPGWSNVHVTNNVAVRKWTDTTAPFNSTYSASNNLFCNTTYSGSWPDTGFTSNCNPPFPGGTAAGGDNFMLGGSQGVDWKPSQYTYGPTSGSTSTPPPPVDTTKPTVSFTSPVNNATISGIVTATASASDNTAVTKVELSLDGSLKMTDTTAPYNYSFDSKTLSNGNHELTARAYDTAGNSSVTSITVNVQNTDTVAPSTPANLRATASNPTTVNLSWSASSDGGGSTSGIAKYNILRNNSVIAQITSTNYVDRNAVANTTYSYTVQAVDNSGNVSPSSVPAVITTPAASDTTDPSIPANLKATVAGATQINLSWNASTDTGGSGIAGYNVYRNGDKVNSVPVTSTSYGDGGLKPSTAYSYKVEAIDGAGNTSSLTAAVNATTPQAVRGDITGPSGVPDGTINLQDISFVIRNYNTTNSTADVSGPSGQPDGKVDLYDLSYIIRNYGK